MPEANDTGRKIIQIFPMQWPDDEDRWLYALCDDGTLWSYNFAAAEGFRWHRMPDLPVPE